MAADRDGSRLLIADGDARFRAMVPQGTCYQILHDQSAFTEGPVWFADLDCLLWSDIPNNRILRWTSDGRVGLFRSPSNHANGNTRDRQGRLITCEHATRRVTRTEVDGSITVIADSYRGRKLNSPNDVVVKSDGSVWFTDPDYGLRQSGASREQDADYVFRVDTRGRLEAVATDFVRPNGLAFSPGERTLYIADSAVSDAPDLPSHIRAFTVVEDGTLRGGEVFATTTGIPDGLRVDTTGNVWASAGRGVNCYSPAGRLLGRIELPDQVANLTFGTPRRNRLFVTAGGGLYAFPVIAEGAQRP